ncbi:MAG TPA: CCA tRNA nucleotidyltransferase, partial [Candidatus Thermoplasmatota archaeon]
MKTHWTKLRPKVLVKIKPTPALTKRAQAASARLAVKARAEAKKLNASVEPLLVGSLAKDTHRTPTLDVDLFLLFPTNTTRENLEKHGIKIGKRILRKPTLRYAEHPYVHGSFAGFPFDVVPAYAITDPTAKMSAVDRSPFHTHYVQKRLKPGQRDEVRILKQFLQGIGCYGAETATSGFSGYLAELFILKFGSFWDALMAFREIHPPILLALEGEPQPLGGDLVFIDPVDPRRNAAAAVSTERLETFQRAARMFTAAPTPEYFWPRPMKAEPRERLTEHLSHRGILGLRVPTPTVRPEARLPHLRRLAEKVTRRLNDEGFRVVRNVVDRVPNGYLLLWEHDPVVLPETYEHRGPPVDDTANSRKFLQKWQNHPEATALPHPHGKNWSVTLRRPHRDPMSILAPDLVQLLKGTDLPKRVAVGGRFGPAMEFAQKPGTRLALTKL